VSLLFCQETLSFQHWGSAVNRGDIVSYLGREAKATAVNRSYVKPWGVSLLIRIGSTRSLRLGIQIR